MADGWRPVSPLGPLNTIPLSRHIWDAHEWHGSLPIAADKLVVMHAALHQGGGDTRHPTEQGDRGTVPSKERGTGMSGEFNGIVGQRPEGYVAVYPESGEAMKDYAHWGRFTLTCELCPWTKGGLDANDCEQESNYHRLNCEGLAAEPQNRREGV